MTDIKVFDTYDDENKSAFSRVNVHMTTEVNRDPRPSWMPQWRPCVVVTLYREGGCCTSIETRGLKNIDACIVHIGKVGYASLTGWGADTDIKIDNVLRVIGYRSEFASAENDLNTGRIRLILDKEDGEK